MLTYFLWSSRKNYSNKTYTGNDLETILFCCFMSIFSIPIDIFILPLEIITLIIYKILNRR